jgi:hypothetical protein
MGLSFLVELYLDELAAHVFIVAVDGLQGDVRFVHHLLDVALEVLLHSTLRLASHLDQFW